MTCFCLFEVIRSDLALGICCDITFVWEKKKHMIGVWGDNGNTYQECDKCYPRSEPIFEKYYQEGK